VPPDGRFRLLEYESRAIKQMPLTLKAVMKLDGSEGQFALTLTSRTNHRPLDDVVVSIFLGEGVSSVSATATGDRKPMGFSSGPVPLSSKTRKDELSEGHAGGGSWEFDPHTQVGRFCHTSSRQ
jgi:AP-3 complex subunit mu